MIGIIFLAAWFGAALSDAAPATAAQPTVPLNRYISPHDYPAAALASGTEGTVAIRMGIDPTGRIHRCEIVESSGNAVLDVATCQLLQRRARFTLARDANDVPIEDIQEYSHEWRRPRGR